MERHQLYIESYILYISFNSYIHATESNPLNGGCRKSGQDRFAISTNFFKDVDKPTTHDHAEFPGAIL